MIRPGDRVRTLKGRHGTEPAQGVVISTGHHWRQYRAVVVKKDNGQKRLFIEKNLVKIEHGWNWELIGIMLASLAFWAIIVWAVVSVMTVRASGHAKSHTTNISKIKQEAAHYSAYPSTISAIAKVQGGEFVGVYASSEKFLSLVLRHGYFKALYYYGGSWKFVAEVMEAKETTRLIK